MERKSKGCSPKEGSNIITLKCHCTAGKHNLEYDEKTEAYIVEMIKEYGDMKKITYTLTGKTYLVPAAYILVHGIKGEDLPKLGFQEYTGKA